MKIENFNLDKITLKALKDLIKSLTSEFEISQIALTEISSNKDKFNVVVFTKNDISFKERYDMSEKFTLTNEKYDTNFWAVIVDPSSRSDFTETVYTVEI